ncbi:MAG TPA: hypothetical protein EYH56_03045 [Nanoarchaeota archaeon]|nr:hypothetical protein [Nanoarchaeota archaeon]
MRLYFAILIALLFFIHTAKADIIVNSQDWRDVYLVLLYAKFKGEEAHYILNLGETDILLKTLSKEKPHKIFESAKKPVINDLKIFMSNYGFTFVEETIFNDYNDLQISLYNAIKEKIKGFIVINPDFGYDAISVFPLAVAEQRWVLFYNKNYENRLLSFLRSNPEKNVIFYGEFLSQPWKKIPNSYEIIYDTPFERNKKVVKEVWEKVNGWIVITNGNYIEKGSLMQAKPILLIRDSPREITNFLKELNVNLIEIIGPENVNFGYRIREISNRTIGVVARVARTFTGDPELRGKMYALDVKPVDVEIHDLRIEKVLWDNNRVVLILKNYGNVKEIFRINAIRVIGEKEYPLRDNNLHIIYPEEYFSIPFYGNFSSVKSIEALITYGNEKLIYKVKNTTTGRYFFSAEIYSFPEIKKPEVLGIFYDDSLEKLWIKVKNPNKKAIWMRAEIYNFNFLGKTIVISSKNVKINPGEGFIPISVYLDSEDLEKNKNLSIAIFYGPSEKIFSGYFILSKTQTIKPQKIEERALEIILILLIVIIAILFAFREKIKNFIK